MFAHGQNWLAGFGHAAKCCLCMTKTQEAKHGQHFLLKSRTHSFPPEQGSGKFELLVGRPGSQLLAGFGRAFRHLGAAPCQGPDAEGSCPLLLCDVVHYVLVIS